MSLLSLVLAPLATSPAWAQRLNLPESPTPPAAANAALLSLAETLKPGAEEPRSADVRSAATASLQRLAHALLLHADETGAAGSIHALTGRTLARHLPALAAVIRSNAGPEGDAIAAILSADARALAARIPPKPDDLDRAMRDLLAPLTRGQSSAPGGPYPAWIDDFPSDAARADLAAIASSLKNTPGVTPEARASLVALGESLAGADGWPGYTRSAAYMRTLVFQAAPILSRPPAWIIAPQRESLGQQFSAAVAALSEVATREVGIAGLERLARVSRVVKGLDRLDQKPVSTRARTDFAAFIAAPPADRADDDRRAAAFDRALTLVLAGREAGDENALVRQVRPAWRTLLAAEKETESRVLEALPEVLTRGDALTNPGLLALFAAHKRAVDDLRALRTISALLDGPGPSSGPVGDPAPDYRRVADRVARTGQDLNSADKRDAALAAIRAFADHVSRFAELPGETALARVAAGNPAPGDEGWPPATGSRIAELVKEIDARRTAWLDAWAKDPASPATTTETDRMRAVALLMTLLADAAVFRTTGPGSPLAASAAWELSPEAREAASDNLEPQLAEATRLVVTGAHAEAAKSLEQLRVRYTVVRAAAALERTAEAKTHAPAAPPGPDAAAAPDDARAALTELASGTAYKGHTWLYARRADLAEICRYTEELGAARRLGATDRVNKLLAYINSKSQRVLDTPD